MREAMSEGDGLGDSEIEQAKLVIGSDLNIGKLDVAMHDSALLAIDIGQERMQPIQLAADLRGKTRGASRLEAFFLFQDIGNGPAFDVMHR